MAKDFVKEGMAFALGLVKISSERFNKVIKGLERKNKVSSKEGERMVYAWVADQQKQLEKMRGTLKKEVLRTRIYSSRDLANINKAIQRLSKEILALQKKKKKAEAAAGKKRKSAKGKAAKKKKR